MKVLGVSGLYHDSAACLVEDGVVAFAVQEEAFTRKKHDASFPAHAIEFCLRSSGVDARSLDAVAFYEDPRRKLERIVSMDRAFGLRPRGDLDAWAAARCDVVGLFPRGFERARVVCPEHHVAHAASAFFPSPFDEAAILTVDGVGEYATTSIGVGRENRVRLIESLSFPNSLGLFYSAMTAYAGFRVNGGEYKLMGLAPYGEAEYQRVLEREVLRIGDDGAFRLNTRYIGLADPQRLVTPELSALLGAEPRQPGAPVRKRDMDVARSAQAILEKAMVALARRAARITRSKNLCMAGGVALNCVANRRVLDDGAFERIWIQPAAGDAGGAVGAALFAYHHVKGRARTPRAPDGMRGALLGPAFSDEDVTRYLAAVGAKSRRLGSAALVAHVAARIARGAVVGWFQGAMEFGPRALGSRSILADPRDPGVKDRLNATTKRRESFRPFAPAVLAEDAERFFEWGGACPYMLFIANVRAGLPLPAVTHVDGTARLQVVDPEQSPSFHRLLQAFKAETGCPVLVNTSFNVRGEPMVATPADALACFLGTDMDCLVLGEHVLERDQPAALRRAVPPRPSEDD